MSFKNSSISLVSLMLGPPHGSAYGTLVEGDGIKNLNDDDLSKAEVEAAVAAAAPASFGTDVSGLATRIGAWRRHRNEEERQATSKCPTCDGHGKVPRDKDLLALIPADDDRLKVSASSVKVQYLI